MIAIWMLRLLVATALIALAARLVEEAARGLGRPRRWAWAGAFVLAGSLPWFGGLVSAPSLVDTLLERYLAAVVAGTPVVLAGATELAASPLNTWRAELQGGLLGGWALASLALAFVFGQALWRIRTAPRRGPMESINGVDVIRSESLGPAAVGIVRPVILLPRWVDQLAEEERALILAHEREHATARDPLLLAAAALVVVAAPWCLPLWWMHRRLRDAAETDCDARVVARGVSRLVYGRTLLRTAGRPRAVVVPFTALPLGGVEVTRLQRRILTMTEHRPKHPLLRAVPLVGLASIAALVGCNAAAHGVGSDITRPTAAEHAEGDRLRVGPELEARSPIFYIDNKRVESSAIKELDPATIERIEVLKGALAVAVYGPGHAAGVVEIYLKNR